MELKKKKKQANARLKSVYSLYYADLIKNYSKIIFNT